MAQFHCGPLFALHPLRVESVARVSERKDVLSAFFGLLALIFYVRYVQRSEARSQKSESNIQTPPSVLRLPSSGSYWLSLLFFALALMSKSMLVTLPCLLLVLDYWPLNRFTIHDSRFTKFRSVLSLVTRHSSLLWEKIPFFLLVVPVSLVTYYSTKGEDRYYCISPGFPVGNGADGLCALSRKNVLAGKL